MADSDNDTSSSGEPGSQPAVRFVPGPFEGTPINKAVLATTCYPRDFKHNGFNAQVNAWPAELGLYTAWTAEKVDAATGTVSYELAATHWPVDRGLPHFHLWGIFRA